MPAEPPVSNPHPCRRRFPRIWGRLQCRLILHPTDGKPVTLVGVTRNLGMNGIFLATFNPVPDAVTECTGSLELGGMRLKKNFPIRVVHANPKGVGMELKASATELGNTLIALLCGAGQERLGVDLMPQEEINATLTMESNRVYSVRLETISSGQFECSLPLAEDLPTVGTFVQVAIPFAGGTINGGSVIRKVEPKVVTHPPQPPDSRIHITALFSAIVSNDRDHINTFIASLHRQRLDAIIRKHSATTALFAEGDTDCPQPRERTSIRLQLQTFLGFKKPRTKANPRSNSSDS
ncbi:MAG: hypothetical protein HQL89_01420 [Magnetococcales bacterium]|nr:hypothetical protein [Magnetococcales bacterium]